MSKEPIGLKCVRSYDLGDIVDDVETLKTEGFDESTAKIFVFNLARASFKKAYPSGPNPGMSYRDYMLKKESGEAISAMPEHLRPGMAEKRYMEEVNRRKEIALNGKR